MRFTPLIILFLILISCKGEKPKTQKGGDSKNEITYAQTLEIFEEKENVRVHIYNPDNKTVKKYYLTKDLSAKIPVDYIPIITPVTSMITLSSTHIGMLSKLNELKTIVGVLDRKYIYNKKIQKGLKSGKVKDFGDEESIAFESVVVSKAQILMYSGFSKDFPHAEQLLKSGTVCISNYEWKENHPLGRAEWIKLFGYLTGKEKDAKDYFSKIEKEYNALKSKVKNFDDGPTVISGNIIGDVWYGPAGDSYFAKLFKDARADYKYGHTKGTGSVQLSMEQILSENRDAKFWLNPGYPSLELVLKSNPKSKYLDAFKNQKVYCYSPKMDFFWENSAIEPQHLLSDLITLFHPEEFKSKLYFYQKLK